MEMVIQRAYKVKLYPNAAQREVFARHAGYARVAYNWGLAYWATTLKEQSAFTHWMGIKKEWNARKYDEYPWAGEMCQRVGEMAIRNLGKALDNYWRKRKAGQCPINEKRKTHWGLLIEREEGFPRLKNRRDRRVFQIFSNECKFEQTRIILPAVFGAVRYRPHGYIPLAGVKYLSVTISEQGGDWYLAVQVEEAVDIQPAEGPVVGVDLGLKVRAAVATAEGAYVKVYENHKRLSTQDRHLKRLQRKLARQNEGGANWYDTKRRIARLESKIANARKHAINEATADIVGRGMSAQDRPTVVGVEDLNVSGMMKNHKLARSIAHVSPFEFRRQLEYKAAWSGSKVVAIHRFYPSSKTCSVCGCIQDMPLDKRVYACPECGAVIDRDVNAARNIAREAAH